MEGALDPVNPFLFAAERYLFGAKNPPDVVSYCNSHRPKISPCAASALPAHWASR
jgi:hypothetical protein